MNIQLNNKNAIVCGSTRGIGKAVALKLAEFGASIILIARNESKLKEVQNELPAREGQLHSSICVDFNEPAKLEEELSKFLRHSPAIHILINNTAGPPPGQAIDADIREYLDAFSRHLVCNQILTRSVVPGMKAEQYGRIVNIISTSVKQPIKGLGVSNTIRGAVANWAKTLSIELASFGITVNNVLPGYTNTQRLHSLMESKARKAEKSVAEIEAAMKASIPAQRFAEPEELANTVLYLASPAAAYINGINLPVDGGRTSSL